MNILAVIDMQKDFLDKEVLGNDEGIAIIPKVVDKIKLNKGNLTFATRDTHQPNYMETQEGKNLPVIHCIENTPGWGIVKEIEDVLIENNAILINKPTFGSFDLVNTIKKYVEENNINEPELVIELCGVCTGICVISNAMLLKAAFPEAKIIVDSECCACVTPETHNTAKEAMKLCQITVL